MAYFFDLGGTLLALDGDEIAYDRSGRVTILPGVPGRLSALSGELVFVVTNQSGLGEGRLDRGLFNGFLEQLRSATGGVITEVAVCAHARSAGCRCRKPQPGLVTDLADRYGVDLGLSTLVGDTPTDAELARAAGVGMFHWASDYFSPP